MNNDIVEIVMMVTPDDALKAVGGFEHRYALKLLNRGAQYAVRSMGPVDAFARHVKFGREQAAYDYLRGAVGKRNAFIARAARIGAGI